MENHESPNDADQGLTRHGFLLETIVKSCRLHSRWMYFWVAFFFLLTCILSLVYIFSRDIHMKHAVLIGAIGTSLGLIGVCISPLTGPAGKGLLNPAFYNMFEMPLKRFMSDSGLSDSDKSEESLDRADSVLRQRAAQEREARLWTNRILAIGVVTALSLVLWLVYHEPLFAFVNEFIGLLITQALFYSQPTAAVRTIELVDREQLGAASELAN